VHLEAEAEPPAHLGEEVLLVVGRQGEDGTLGVAAQEGAAL